MGKKQESEYRETEGTVAGAWIKGEHLEDLKLCVPSDFIFFAPIVKALQDGERDIFEISKKSKMPMSEIAPILGSVGNSLYESAFQQVLTRKQQRIIENIKDRTGRELELALDKVYEISERKRQSSSQIRECKHILEEMLNTIDNRAKSPIVTWGIPTLDNRMFNVMRGELTTIAARPSVGKSTIMLQIARHIAEQGNRVLFFPLEMTPQSLFWRIVLSETGVSNRGVKTGRFTKEEFERLTIGFDIVQKIEESGNLKLFADIYKIEEIHAAIQQFRPYAVFIDQLTQVDTQPSFDSTRAKVNYITRSLKRIAQQENTAVILACQINRSAQNRIPTIAELKESGSIEEDSDNVILLHRYSDEYAAEQGIVYDPQKAKPIRVEVAKQRNGETGYDDMLSSLGRFQFIPIDFRDVSNSAVDVPF